MTDRAPWPLWLVPMLVVALAATWWWQSSDDAVVSGPIPPLASAPSPLAAPAPIPLIAPTPIPVAKPVESALSASGFKLVGTVVAADGTDSFALLRRTSDSQLMRLRAGDRVEGLTVSAIKPDSVVLVGATRAIVIEAGRTATAPVSPMPYRAVRPAPEPEPAWAGDPAPFGH